MKRTQIYLEDEVHRQLSHLAAATGTTKSALIREAIAAFVDESSDRERRLARFRMAVRAAAELGAVLPAGADYVDDLRESGS